MRVTQDVREYQRLLMVLLSYEGKSVKEISQVVRESDDTVRRWLKRYNSEGLNGLADAPRSGAPRKVSAAYRAEVVRVVRMRPRSLEQPYNLWTLERLVEYMAVQTGVRVGCETVRRVLAEAEIVMSRPHHKVSSPDPEYEVKKRRLKRNERA